MLGDEHDEVEQPRGSYLFLNVTNPSQVLAGTHGPALREVNRTFSIIRSINVKTLRFRTMIQRFLSSRPSTPTRTWRAHATAAPSPMRYVFENRTCIRCD